MSFGKVVVVLLLVKASSTLYDDHTYRVPQPLIEVLHPRGFRISIEDTPGNSYVSFQVNINKQLDRHSEGRFIGNIDQAVNGRWTFEEPSVRLRIGDKIYYGVYVINNKLRYGKVVEKHFLVRELPSNPLETSTLQSIQSIRSMPCESCKSNHKFQTYPATPSPGPTTDSYSSICQQLLLNCSESLSTRNSELETVKRANQQLIALLEKDPNAKKLTLSGRIPPDGGAALTATFIIREKLELNPDIVSAVRKSDRSIVFEVATLSEKLEILEMAEEKLRNSRILIS